MSSLTLPSKCTGTVRRCRVPVRSTAALVAPRLGFRQTPIRHARIAPLQAFDTGSSPSFFEEPETSTTPTPPPPKEEEESFAAVTVSTGGDGEMSVADIKAALLDSLYGTERGLSARSEIRAEINELISQIEAKNPTPNPTEALDKLSGNWKLVYTCNSELMTVLALSKLPFVEVGDVTQKIDAVSLTVENQVHLTVPFSRTTFSTTASFEARSPKRLQLRLTKGGIQTPELLTDMELPTNVTVLGQALDLSQLKEALTPVNDRVKGLLGQVNSLLSQTPDLTVNIQNERAQTWQLNTYVDDDTRICRGDGGSVFIYVRDVSFSA